MSKYQCPECGWEGKYDEILNSVNPFNYHTTITGCPSCKTVTRLLPLNHSQAKCELRQAIVNRLLMGD